MVRYTKKIILIASFCVGLLQLSYAQTPVKQEISDSAIESAILVHINQYRQQHGLSQLKMDSRISREARKHSLDMARHAMPFGHQYFNKRIAQLHKEIKNSNAGAENVAFNYKSAQDVVNNWVKSPGHKQNIEGNYNLTGIGIARDTNGKIYFTQIFLKTGSGNKYAVRRPLSNFFHKPLFSKNS